MDFTLCDIEGFYDGIEDWLKANRPIIAAVARCAWLDEAGNTGSSGFNICWEEPYGSAYLSEIEMERVRECIKLADAWAKWGRGEEDHV
jgi:hypothetical protein